MLAKTLIGQDGKYFQYKNVLHLNTAGFWVWMQQHVSEFCHFCFYRVFDLLYGSDEISGSVVCKMETGYFLNKYAWHVLQK